MKQDEYSTANWLWNAGATEVQQLNPGGSNQRHHQTPANLTESFMPESWMGKLFVHTVKIGIINF